MEEPDEKPISAETAHVIDRALLAADEHLQKAASAILAQLGSATDGGDITEVIINRTPAGKGGRITPDDPGTLLPPITGIVVRNPANGTCGVYDPVKKTCHPC